MRRRPEARLEADILLALGQDPHVALYRNEIGQGYYGTILPQLRALLKHTSWMEPVLEVLHRNRVTYGLGIGSPDLVGIGKGGRFVGLELKAGTQPSRGQVQWHAAALSRGARIAIVRSVEDAWEVVT